MNKLKLIIALGCMPFLLTACGEGWEMKLTEAYTPYGNTRTAGSGVAYVLAKMKPERSLKLPASETIAPAETRQPEPEPHDVLEALDAETESMFKEKMQK